MIFYRFKDFEMIVIVQKCRNYFYTILTQFVLQVESELCENTMFYLLFLFKIYLLHLTSVGCRTLTEVCNIAENVVEPIIYIF